MDKQIWKTIITYMTYMLQIKISTLVDFSKCAGLKIYVARCFQLNRNNHGSSKVICHNKNDGGALVEVSARIAKARSSFARLFGV